MSISKTVRNAAQTLGVCALGLALGLALAGGQANAQEESGGHVFHRKGSFANYGNITRGREDLEFLLTAEQTNGRYSVIDLVFRPGFDSAPGHTHLYHSELFYIVAGQMEWTVNDDTQVIGPGDLLYIPPKSLHHGKIIGDEVAHVILLFEPAGWEKGVIEGQDLTDEQRADEDFMREFDAKHDIVYD